MFNKGVSFCSFDTSFNESEKGSYRRCLLKRVRSKEERKRHNASQQQYYNNQRSDPQLVFLINFFTCKLKIPLKIKKYIVKLICMCTCKYIIMLRSSTLISVTMLGSWKKTEKRLVNPDNVPSTEVRVLMTWKSPLIVMTVQSRQNTCQFLVK